MRWGVLALQGDWAAHLGVLRELVDQVVEVRTAAEVDALDGMVIPGGESTTMLRLLDSGDLGRAIVTANQRGMALLGTCAGLILLASAVEPHQRCLELLDVDVQRNAYGRQLQSKVATVTVNGALGPPATMEGVFIRAPRIARVGNGVRVLGWLGDDPVIVQQGRVLAASFHPELTADHRLHRLAVSLGEEVDG